MTNNQLCNILCGLAAALAFSGMVVLFFGDMDGIWPSILGIFGMFFGLYNYD